MAASTLVSTTTNPEARRWTRDEYYQMGELGWFLDQRVELIDGDVVMMSPQKWRHAAAIDRLADVLKSAFGTGCWVRTQLPITLSSHSEPEPDASVVEGARDDYTDHPMTALLIVEVSDTTLAFDRNKKGGLYAAAGIDDYWIVNLIDRQLEVYRSPTVDDSQPSAFEYADRTILVPGDVVVPLAAPQPKISVAELFD